MPKIKIETYFITTSMGKLSKTMGASTLLFLTDEERKEFDTVGYTGKNNAGKRTTYSEFLSSLGKGTFEVRQTRFDSGDLVEKFIITRAYTK